MEQQFPRFFNAEELGESLKEVARDIISTPDNHKIISRWFHSSKDADLFIWLDMQQNVIKQQLTFFGQVVEWNVVEGVKTGLIVEDETPSKVKASEIVQFDQNPQRAPIEQARALLKAITALNDIERQRLVGNLANLDAKGSVSPEEFVKRFGAYLSKKPEEQKPGFWSWLRRLFGDK